VQQIHVQVNPDVVMTGLSEPKSEKLNAHYSKKCQFLQKQSQVNPGTIFSMTLQEEPVNCEMKEVHLRDMPQQKYWQENTSTSH